MLFLPLQRLRHSGQVGDLNKKTRKDFCLHQTPIPAFFLGSPFQPLFKAHMVENVATLGGVDYGRWHIEVRTNCTANIHLFLLARHFAVAVIENFRFFLHHFSLLAASHNLNKSGVA
jgi:hypothetical protein